ncbi:unnamed protein product [Periconia digitata]|uniref:Methyltransferase type 12 domain-containing protein n=1 Tax=Periconia digitata TaxID=1303443 RepID=A0A9W4UQS6_9PLEO|nr:unnamed protein product [Periconia digitata]
MSAIKEANRKYFDTITDSYDSKPFFIKCNEQLTTHLRDNLAWVGVPFVDKDSNSSNGDQTVRLLDYACGTGLMSRIFGPYVTVTRGIDVSPGMVKTFNRRASEASLPTSTIHAVEGDLLDKNEVSPESLSGPEWNDFDLATAGFAFHHFEDVVYAARRLKERLRPGGVLLISDFLEGGDLKADENGDPIPGSEMTWSGHGHHHHDHHHGHHHGGHDHMGEHNHVATAQDDDDPTANVRKEMNASIVTTQFSLDNVRNFFTEAGLVDVDVTTMKDKVYMEFAGNKMWRTVLFARGRRPLADQNKSEL